MSCSFVAMVTFHTPPNCPIVCSGWRSYLFASARHTQTEEGLTYEESPPSCKHLSSAWRHRMWTSEVIPKRGNATSFSAASSPSPLSSPLRSATFNFRFKCEFEIECGQMFSPEVLFWFRTAPRLVPCCCFDRSRHNSSKPHPDDCASSASGSVGIYVFFGRLFVTCLVKAPVGWSAGQTHGERKASSSTNPGERLDALGSGGILGPFSRVFCSAPKKLF